MRYLIILPLLFAALNVQGMVGANDPASAAALDRLNHQATLLRKLDYSAAVINLRRMATELSANPYALSRIRNELADLLTNRTLEIEAAVDVDRQLLGSMIPDTDKGTDTALYQPRNLAAVNRLLLDKDHFTEYVAVDAMSLKSRAQERLETNILLLAGKVRPRKTVYTKEFLDESVRRVRSDINATYAGTADRKRLQSRLIRVDYELIRLTGKSIEAYGKFLSGEMKVEDVDFGEITFLELSDYFSLVFKMNGNIQIAENALNAVYLPYLNLMDSSARWNYNKIINDYITNLIESNYQTGRFDEMLYYVSLNKSRMLLEERATFGGIQRAGKKLSDILIDDGIPRTAGLPDKVWFKAKLVSSPQFLDFYVGGTYVPEMAATGSKSNRAERSVMPLISRNASRVRPNEPTETFKDDVLYLTQVSGGRVAAIKLVEPQLSELREEMKKSYDAISNERITAVSPIFSKLKTRLQLSGSLTVSPDKWVATHPLDFHLQSKVVRSVNFFTSGESNKLDGIRVAGFFNPTLDLTGADGEADVIKATIPTATVVRREAANKSALNNVAGANVIHLSMHGYFNAADPTLSKLMFAGAAVDDSSADPRALFASEMASFSALRDRDLVFAAACQTGLLAADRTNSSELTGILRPLTANRNKNVILSLWNVSDQATAEFVKAFYQKLAVTQDVTVSFHYAQDQLRAKYPHPYYWAAFYLSQAN